MESIVLKVLEEISMPHWVVLLIIGAGYFFIKEWKFLIDYILDRKHRKIDELIKYKDKVDEEYSELINQEIKGYIFYRCTGIPTYQELREKILFTSTQYNIPIFYFKRAINFLKIDNKELKIKVTKLDYVGKWFNIIFGSILLITAIALFLIPSIPAMMGTELNSENKSSILALLPFYPLVLIFSLLGVFVLAQNEKLNAAEYIKKKIECSDK